MLFSHPTANQKPQLQRDQEEILQMAAHFRLIDLKKVLKFCKQKTTGQKNELHDRLQEWVKKQKRYSEPFLELVRHTFSMCPTEKILKLLKLYFRNSKKDFLNFSLYFRIRNSRSRRKSIPCPSTCRRSTSGRRCSSSTSSSHQRNILNGA